MAKKNTVLEIPEIEQGLTTLVKEAKIELTKAEGHAMAFNPFLRQLSEYSRPLAELDKENPTSGHALTARENRLKIVKVRTGAEDIKDERKAILLLEGNFIQANYNFVKSACELTEAQYLEIEKHQEKLERQRQAELEETRTALLLPYETDLEFLPLGQMTDEQFEKLLAKERESFEAVTAKRAKDEAERIEAERLAEATRIEVEKVEAERIRLQAVENERLKKEAEAREKELAKERAENEKKAKEAAELLAKQNAENEAKLKAEREAREKVEKELQAKQEQEEREKQQAIAEQNEREAQAKALLLGPDKDKVKAFYNQFIALQFPDLSSDPGKAMAIRVNEAIAIVKQVIIQDSKTLL